MIVEIYFFTILMLTAIIFILGLMFWRLDAYRNHEFHNYRPASRMMIHTYGFFGFFKFNVYFLKKYTRPFILLFYNFFAIRFFNCGSVLKKESEDLSVADRVEKEKLSFAVTNTIEVNLKEWVEKKQYLISGITIEEVSAQIGTNIKYLSVYINKYKGKTFREWINDLKIGEAKVLLLVYPEMTVNEIALRTGFANQSNFGRQFLKHTKESPGAWRKKAELRTIPNRYSKRE